MVQSRKNFFPARLPKTGDSLSFLLRSSAYKIPKIRLQFDLLIMVHAFTVVARKLSYKAYPKTILFCAVSKFLISRPDRRFGIPIFNSVQFYEFYMKIKLRITFAKLSNGRANPKMLKLHIIILQRHTCFRKIDVLEHQFLSLFKHSNFVIHHFIQKHANNRTFYQNKIHCFPVK